MGDQRRRGNRGRSGRGGRIPRKGDAPAGTVAQDEGYVSFPLHITGPIKVTPAIDEAAVERLLRDTLERERWQVAALEALSAVSPEAPLAALRTEVERHREVLEQMGRDLGADLSEAANPRPDPEAGVSSRDVVAAQRLVRLGWIALQRAAYASGDQRIDRLVKPVLREKERHAMVLEAYSSRLAARSLFREADY